MIYIYKTLRGLEIECELEYEPEDQEVGFPASSYLIAARVAGVDISDVMDDRLISQIEEAATCSMLG